MHPAAAHGPVQGPDVAVGGEGCDGEVGRAALPERAKYGARIQVSDIAEFDGVVERGVAAEDTVNAAHT